MANEWYYTLNGQQQPAPTSTTALRQLAADGVLQPTDLIWQDGMPNWVAASSVKGLFTPKPAPDPPAPPAAPEKPLIELNSNRGTRGSAKRASRSVEKPAAETSASEMHPLLVLLLSAITCGLFGLFYAYAVCAAANRDGVGAKDSAGRPLGQVRHPLGSMLLGFLTAGLYSCYALSRQMDECAAYLGRKEVRSRTELSLMFICPPYALVLSVFRLPELIRAAASQAGAAAPEGLPTPALLGNPFAILALPVLEAGFQETLNRIWRKASGKVEG
jgi:GYF domain 2/Domain of unknown function (DUF4234)